MINVIVTGAAGRMGSTIIGLINEHENLNLVGAIEREGFQSIDAGIPANIGEAGISIVDNINKLENINSDVIIDFTMPEATMKTLEFAVRNKIAVVIGTTGLTDVHRSNISEAAKTIPVVQSPNMSVGVNTLFKITEMVAKILNDYDVEIVEAHHRFKKDAPSGTAVKLGEIVEIVKTKSKILKKDTTVEYVELSDINTHSFEIINSTTLHTSELPSRASYELKENDIITAVAGNSIGTKKHATALVTDEYENAICTNGFRILRNPKIDIYYLLYYLRSQAFLKQVFMYRTGAAIPAISDNDLSRILIYIPEKKELEQISNNVKQSFNLRKTAKKILENTKLEIINNAPQHCV